MRLTAYLKAVVAVLIILVAVAPSLQARQSDEIFGLPPGPIHHSDNQRDPALVNSYTQSDSPISTSRIAVDSSGNVGSHTSLALSSTGRPVISYFDISNADLKLAVCDDLECANPTIETLEDYGTVGQYSSVALTADDRPVISYYDATNFEALKLARCDNPLCTSHNTLTVDDGYIINDVGRYSSLALTDSGHPVISYYDATDGDLKLAVCSSPSCAIPIIRILDYAGNVGWDTSLALTSDGRPVISYYDATNGDLKLARCDNPLCTSHTTGTVDGFLGDVGQQTSLALNSSGHPVISYHDVSNDNLKLAVCLDLDPTCNSPFITVVDSGGNVGLSTSLRLTAGDQPVISYFDVSDINLKIAACGNLFCGNPAITVVDGLTGHVGSYTSLALDDAGRPVVSYYDQGNDDLKLALCGICRAPNLTIIDSGGLGEYSSLAITSGGYPRISYYDNNNDNLKLAVCKDLTCATPVLKTLDSVGNVGAHTSLALTGSNHPIISYLGVNVLKLAVCNDADCSTNTTHIVDDGDLDYPLQSTSLALNSSGNPIISYYSYDPNSGVYLKLALCPDPTCSSPVLRLVEGVGDVSLATTSLALNSNGYPVISYFEEVNRYIKLALCNDPTCSSPALTVVTSGGSHNSLALNSNDYPVISYYYYPNGELRLAVCLTPDCSVNTVKVIDSGGTTSQSIGWYNSLTLDSRGYPVVSYFDGTNEELKLAVCESTLCEDPTLTTIDSNGSVGTHTSLALTSSGYPAISYYGNNIGGELKLAIFSPPERRVYLPIILR